MLGFAPISDIGGDLPDATGEGKDGGLTHWPVSRTLRFVSTYGSGDEVWTVLGDRTRRTILECLAQQPMAVVEIAERLPVSRPAVSQHLKLLKDAGLVSEDAAGRRHIYRLNAAGVSALRDQLDTFWNRALAGYEATLDRTTEDQR
jgi:DNA-binding transcriptional ArsR family regulator